MNQNQPQSIRRSNRSMSQGVAVVVDEADLLGAGEEPAGRLGGGPRRDRHRVHLEIGLVVMSGLGRAREAARGTGRRSPGTRAVAQYLSVMPSQPRSLVVGNRRLVLERRCSLTSSRPSVAEDADQPLVQDVVAGGLRLAEARHPPVGRERHRAGRGVGDRVGDREHVVVVDRDRRREDEAGAVVIGERQRRRRGQPGVARGRPHRVRTGGFSAASPIQPNSAK